MQGVKALLRSKVITTSFVYIIKCLLPFAGALLKNQKQVTASGLLKALQVHTDQKSCLHSFSLTCSTQYPCTAGHLVLSTPPRLYLPQATTAHEFLLQLSSVVTPALHQHGTVLKIRAICKISEAVKVQLSERHFVLLLSYFFFRKNIVNDLIL